MINEKETSTKKITEALKSMNSEAKIKLVIMSSDANTQLNIVTRCFQNRIGSEKIVFSFEELLNAFLELADNAVGIKGSAEGLELFTEKTDNKNNIFKQLKEYLGF